jgi:hypothetical protein
MPPWFETWADSGLPPLDRLDAPSPALFATGLSSPDNTDGETTDSPEHARPTAAAVSAPNNVNVRILDIALLLG